MKKSFQIFKRDLGRLFRNRAAVLILVGISVLPSLYAWFNIAANMDPYGNTKGIQVAIANEDKGADSEQMSLDAGQNIVDNLKKNDQLGWKFVDAKESKKGVRSGKYYAAIVIPDNFSESLLSILSGDIKQPKLDYYINEKKNAIAPKITATASRTTGMCFQFEMLTAGRSPNTVTPPKQTAMDLYRPHFSSSMKKETPFCSSATPLVIAPIDSIRKNNPAQIHPVPPGKRLNVAGRMLKIRLGPTPGSNPIANTAGKIARPARIAASVSRTITQIDAEKMFCSFFI